VALGTNSLGGRHETKAAAREPFQYEVAFRAAVESIEVYPG
jgi:hypothetical protein